MDVSGEAEEDVGDDGLGVMEGVTGTPVVGKSLERNLMEIIYGSMSRGMYKKEI